MKGININKIHKEKNFSTISSKEALKDVEPFLEENKELESKLSLNMNKAVLFANKNTTQNEQGYVVLKKDDEWRDEDELINDIFEAMIVAGGEFKQALNLSDDDVLKSITKCSEKYKECLTNLTEK